MKFGKGPNETNICMLFKRFEEHIMKKIAKFVNTDFQKSARSVWNLRGV